MSYNYSATLVHAAPPMPVNPSFTLTLKVLVTKIDAQWEGMGDVGSARYEPVNPSFTLTLKVLVAKIDAQWEGMGDVGSARYELALLPPCPTIRVLSYSN